MKYFRKIKFFYIFSLLWKKICAKIEDLSNKEEIFPVGINNLVELGGGVELGWSNYEGTAVHPSHRVLIIEPYDSSTSLKYFE